MRSNRPPALASALACALATCGGEPPEIRTEMTDEGPVVVNLRTVDQVPEGSLRPLWSRQAPDWVDPFDVEMNGRGRIAVVDGAASRVHLFASRDTPIVSLGRQGEGPGEWAGVSDAIFERDRLWVLPTRTTRLEAFDSAGQQTATLEVPEPGNLLSAGDSVLIVASRTRAELMALDLATGESIRRITPRGDRYDPETYGSCWRQAATPGRIVRISCAAGRIQVLGPSGDHERWIELVDQPRASTDAELDAYLDRFWQLRSGGRSMNSLIERQLANVRDRAAVYPKYALLRADRATGRIVVLEQAFGEYGVEPGVLHVIAPDGRHALRVPLERTVRDLEVFADTLAMLTRDPATDVVRLDVALIEGG